MVAKCPECGFGYVVGIREDEKDHARCHATWERGVEAIGFVPMNGVEQERASARGRAILASATTDAERIQGAGLIIRAQLHRSLERAIRDRFAGKHPDFAGYVALISGWDQVPDAVLALVREEYGVQATAGIIPPGDYRWRPAGRGRKQLWELYRRHHG